MADFNRGVSFEDQEEIHRGRPPRAISGSMQTITREYVRKANREGTYIPTTKINLNQFLISFSCATDKPDDF